MSPVKPVEGTPLTFWHVAGSIIWRGEHRPEPIDASDAIALRGLYSVEARVAFCAGDIPASAKAAGLWLELTRALDALSEWARVVGRTIPELEERRAA